MASIWTKTVDMPQCPYLPGDVSVQAAVIGGGLSGLNTAYFLAKNGIDTIVLEKNRVGSGQSGHTTAKITSQHGLIYDDLIGNFGDALARQYALANQSAIEAYRRIIQDEHISCDFENQPAYLYACMDSGALEKEADAANRLGIDAHLTKDTALPFPIKSALRFENQAMFHPLKYLRALAEALTVYENTAVKSVAGHRIETDRGVVHAEHIIFASHYPFVNIPGYYFMRMHRERSYVIALENAAMLDGMYIGIDKQWHWTMRNHQNLLLFGGCNHRTGENSAGGRYELLKTAAQRFWPGSRIVAQWSAQDCMPLDGVPYIGLYASSEPSWYVATGFQKWGMTTSMVSAMILSDMIAGRTSPYAEVFSPRRFEPLISAGEFMKNSVKSAKGLLRTLFNLPQSTLDEIPCGHSGIVTYQDETWGVYKDDNGRAYVVSVRCPHLGCQLTWNADELSWDCPCHGSRFDYRGRLLDNPAQEDLQALPDTGDASFEEHDA